MTSKIETLVLDIQSLLVKGGRDIPDSAFEELGRRMGEAVKHSMNREKKATLRMSNIGKPCNRQIYYGINSPEEAEETRPEAYMKFLTGHLLEEMLLFLAEQSGHRVEGLQDESEISGIKGHRDAVIDGVLIDVKSASSFSFKKFADGRLAEDDPFGYVIQLQSYLHAGQDDEKVEDKSRGGFLVVDKALGHICLDFHPYQGLPMEAIYDYKKKMVEKPEPPVRSFEAVPDGKSGNMKLGVNCSYCDFKQKCWPGLRGFAYSNGPRFLTKIVREPDVPEV